MATFSGGETLVSVQKVSINATGTNTTYYTVPAGRYAKINIQRASVTTAPGDNVSFNIGSIKIDQTTMSSGLNQAEKDVVKEIIIFDGETIKDNGGAGTFTLDCVIREFTQP